MIDKISQLFKEINEYQFLNHEKGKYDFIIVSPIYTQLIFQQLQENLKILIDLNYPMESIDFLRNEFLKYMPKLIHTFNQNVLKLLAKDGIIINISDIFEFNPSTAEWAYISKIKDNQDALSKYHEQYLQKYGFGLGDYGQSDMEINLYAIDSRWFIWNFSSSKFLLVKTVIYKG